MTSIVMLVVFCYVSLIAGALVKGLAKGLMTATGSGLLAAAYWLSTPQQWHDVCSVTVWIGIAFGALALIGGAVEEASG